MKWIACYLGLGSNLGPRKSNLLNAIKILEKDSGIRVRKVSSIYESSPLGPSKRNYLNCAARIQTIYSPKFLLSVLKKVEKKMGRKKTVRWGPRVIDCDILTYGELKMKTSSLTIPHPEIQNRKFVLRPLSELKPNLTIPGLKEPVAKIYAKIKKTNQKLKKI